MIADIEQCLVAWAAPRWPGVRVCTELPAELPAQVVRFTRINGGVRPSIGFDIAPIDVDCYAASRAAAHDLAELVASDFMYALPGATVNGALFVTAELSSAPAWAPYDNTNVRRMTAAYRIRSKHPQ